jgi:hypothetical protein
MSAVQGICFSLFSLGRPDQRNWSFERELPNDSWNSLHWNQRSAQRLAGLQALDFQS